MKSKVGLLKRSTKLTNLKLGWPRKKERRLKLLKSWIKRGNICTEFKGKKYYISDYYLKKLFANKLNKLKWNRKNFTMNQITDTD